MSTLLRRGLVLMAASPLFAGVARALGGDHPSVLDGGSVLPLVAQFVAFIAFGGCLLVGATMCVMAVMRARSEEEPFAMDAAMAGAVCVGAFQLGRVMLTRGAPPAPAVAVARAGPAPWGGAGVFGLLVSAAVMTGAVVAIRRARRF